MRNADAVLRRALAVASSGAWQDRVGALQEAGRLAPWTCPSCTFLNASHPSICEACDLPNAAYESIPLEEPPLAAAPDARAPPPGPRAVYQGASPTAPSAASALDADPIERVARLLAQSRSVAVFTGAGLSVASGIPDFRSPGGLWERFDPEVAADYQAFLRDPAPFWDMMAALDALLASCRPNAGHRALAALEGLGLRVAVVTQNIDSLHAAAGSSAVVELHGHCRTARCALCGDAGPYAALVAQGPRPYQCRACGSLRVKPDLVLFGEPLPPGALDAGLRAVRDCDVLLVVGSSLSVAPANALPRAAREAGARVVVVATEATALDGAADVCVRGRSEVVLPRVVQRLRELRA